MGETPVDPNASPPFLLDESGPPKDSIRTLSIRGRLPRDALSCRRDLAA